MKKVRLGIIGMGNIGKFHADYLLSGRIERCELAAVCDPFVAALDRYRPLPVFSDGLELLRSGLVDAVIISTPHFQHTTLGIAAFENGIHALVEKPISSHKADAERLIAAHRKRRDLVFAGMFQFRLEPRYLKIRDSIQHDIGVMVRVNWLNTDWFRTEAYYRSSEWRATWKGEGGGVLLNQCLHNLDVLQWLCGMPRRVRGFCQFGRFHQIEVEDNVSAYLEWDSGATGSFISSTGEAPGANRFEIVGTRGTLVLENGKLTLTRNRQDMVEFSRFSSQGFAKPETTLLEIPFENVAQPHAAMTRNFVNAILEGEPLVAPGAEGIYSVELANAMVYSSLLERTLELPMDAAAWEDRLTRLIADSKFNKAPPSTHSDENIAQFFQR